MKAIKTAHSNFVYRGPEPGIGDLHCERRTVDGAGRTAIFSTWQLSDEDRAAIAAGTPPCPSCGARYFHAHFSWCEISPERIAEVRVA